MKNQTIYAWKIDYRWNSYITQKSDIRYYILSDMRVVRRNLDEYFVRGFQLGTYWRCYQKQPSRGVFIKRCFENMQQMYRGAPIPKFDFNKVQNNFFEIILRHWCSPVNLLLIFRIPFPKNTSEGLLLCHRRIYKGL